LQQPIPKSAGGPSDGLTFRTTALQTGPFFLIISPIPSAPPFLGMVCVFWLKVDLDFWQKETAVYLWSNSRRWCVGQKTGGKKISPKPALWRCLVGRRASENNLGHLAPKVEIVKLGGKTKRAAHFTHYYQQQRL
jgi:hypothetical protein